MNGEQFYTYLRKKYSQPGEKLYGNYTFNKWLLKKDGLLSFQFKGKTQCKSIPISWLVDSKNEKNRGEVIDRNWFNHFYGKRNNNDCRASVAIRLLKKY